LRRIVVVAEVTRECRPTHSDFDVFANLQMQVGIMRPCAVPWRRSSGRDGRRPRTAMLSKCP
jgi:hypothetical protein